MSSLAPTWHRRSPQRATPGSRCAACRVRCCAADAGRGAGCGEHGSRRLEGRQGRGRRLAGLHPPPESGGSRLCWASRITREARLGTRRNRRRRCSSCGTMRTRGSVRASSAQSRAPGSPTSSRRASAQQPRGGVHAQVGHLTRDPLLWSCCEAWVVSGRTPSATPPPPPPRTKWTRRVLHLVLIGHAASLTPYQSDGADARGGARDAGGARRVPREQLHGRAR